MRRICEQAEAVLDYKQLYLNMRRVTLDIFGKMSTVESVCSSAVKATVDSGCPLIVALTETGSTAQIISKYRPKCPILAITASESTARQLCCSRGVISMHTASFVGTDAVIKQAVARAKELGMVKAGDEIVAIHGQQEECPGHSNLLKMVIVQ